MENRTAKLLILLMILTIVFSLTACGKEEGKETEIVADATGTFENETEVETVSIIDESSKDILPTKQSTKNTTVQAITKPVEVAPSKSKNSVELMQSNYDIRGLKVTLYGAFTKINKPEGVTVDYKTKMVIKNDKSTDITTSTWIMEYNLKTAHCFCSGGGMMETEYDLETPVDNQSTVLIAPPPTFFDGDNEIDDAVFIDYQSNCVVITLLFDSPIQTKDYNTVELNYGVDEGSFVTKSNKKNEEYTGTILVK